MLLTQNLWFGLKFTYNSTIEKGFGNKFIYKQVLGRLISPTYDNKLYLMSTHFNIKIYTHYKLLSLLKLLKYFSHQNLIYLDLVVVCTG